MIGSRWKRRLIAGTAALTLFSVAAAARAQVELRFSPRDTTLEVSQTSRLSIILDAALEVRTLDVNVTYDTTIVRSLGGGAGSLYTNSGIFTFQGFEEETLGHWHGYAVLMGADLFVEGPGELYTWDFETLADGLTAITAIEVYLSTTDGSWFEDVTLPAATVTVGEGPSPVVDIPSRQSGLDLWPNPFNPRTRIRFDLPRTGAVRLTVYDVCGRRIDDLLHTALEAGPHIVDWNGRHADGRAAPAGIYLFRLEGPGILVSTRGALVK
jgi:FlgD Ig-like domain